MARRKGTSKKAPNTIQTKRRVSHAKAKPTPRLDPAFGTRASGAALAAAAEPNYDIESIDICPSKEKKQITSPSIPTLSSFHHFPKLSTELQLRIWALVPPSPRVITRNITVQPPPTGFAARCGDFGNLAEGKPCKLSFTGNGKRTMCAMHFDQDRVRQRLWPVLHACRQSRNEWLDVPDMAVESGGKETPLPRVKDHPTYAWVYLPLPSSSTYMNPFFFAKDIDILHIHCERPFPLPSPPAVKYLILDIARSYLVNNLTTLVTDHFRILRFPDLNTATFLHRESINKQGRIWRSPNWRALRLYVGASFNKVGARMGEKRVLDLGERFEEVEREFERWGCGAPGEVVEPTAGEKGQGRGGRTWYLEDAEAKKVNGEE